MEIETPCVGECIQVGDVTITVLAVDGNGNQVRLGISSAAQHDGEHPNDVVARVLHERYRTFGYEH
jgi:sRNA-binding carbon storage regulator CsrA